MYEAEWKSVEGLVKKLAHSYGRGHTAAEREDIHQTASLAALEAIKSYNAESLKLSTYVYHRVRDRLTTAQRRKALDKKRTQPIVCVERCVDESVNIFAGELPASIDAALALIPPKVARMVRRRHGLDGGEPQSMEQIAKATGCTRQWVQFTIAKWVPDLQRALKEYRHDRT